MEELQELLARVEDSVGDLVAEVRKRDELCAGRTDRECASALLGLPSFEMTDTHCASDWVQLTAARAEDVLARVLVGKLTTGMYEYLTESDAVATAKRFMELVGLDGLYFTNLSGESPGSRGYSFAVARDSTLDVGVVGVGADCVAGIWLFDYY